jgi:folate-binding protein YgfZ
MSPAPTPAVPPSAAAGPRAAWIPLPARSCLRAHGKDAVAFVDHFTTAAVTRLEPGGCCAGFFTDARGAVLALTSIMRTGTGLWIDAAPDVAAPLRDHLEHYHIREDVALTDESAARASFLLIGPGAEAWLASHGSGARPPQPLAHGDMQLGEIAAAVARPAWCGPDGFLVQVAAEDGPRLAAWLDAAALPRAAATAADAVRIEAGWPDPADILPKSLPQELDGDARAISFTKGCYLGQETVARIDALGHVNRRLVGLATARAVPAGAEVRCGDAPVARVTSTCFSPRLAAGLGLALVPLKALAGDQPLDVGGEPARVVPLPLPAAAQVMEELLLETRRFRVVRVPQPCADGSVAAREVVVHPGSVVVVPLVTPDEVCLVEVVRVAVGGTLLELPAGTLDRVEPLAAAAARELAEETGYRAGTIEAAGSFWMSPGILRERMHLFVARDLVAGPQALEPGEQISTRQVPWAEAVAMCRDGRIEDAKTIAGILLLDARRRAGD